MKKTIQYVRGFTLIELLVVIAIIGILSSVILVSLNSARNKGLATRVQEDATNIRTQLETDFNGSTYPDLHLASGTTGSDDGTLLGTSIGALTADINKESGTTPGYKIYDSGTSATAITGYAIYVLFPTATTGGYCVDSTGNTKIYSSGTAFSATSNAVTCASGL